MNLINQLTDIWSDVLNKDILDTDIPFFDLGGDSISVGYMHKKINDTFNISLSIMDLFKYTTIEDMANYLEGLIELKESK
jgi:acyl carrier protein